MDSCSRTGILLGLNGIKKLWNQHVLVAGLGGVGGACAEALCRAGVGKMTIIDHDDISDTNINRQIIALNSNIGQPKVYEWAKRLQDISPTMELIVERKFIKVDEVDLISQDNSVDYVLDCIDSIACKSALVASCLANDKKIISAMGAGGRLDPTKVKVVSLNQTSGDGLAREMRKSLRRLGAPLNYPVVFSSEDSIKALPHEPVEGNDVCASGRARAVNGSISYMPNIFGLVMAGYVVQQIVK